MVELRRHRLTIAAVLVVMALVLRAAVPAGWMPESTETGVRVMLCSGKGAVELRIPDTARALRALPDGKAIAPAADNDGPHRDKAPRDPCPFGTATGNAFALPSPPDMPVLPVFAAHLAAQHTIAARAATLRGLRPPARAPPPFA